MNKKKIKVAANNYVKDQLGDEQYKSNKSAVKAISDDFTAGANWLKKHFESVEETTVRNMDNVSHFVEHLKAELGYDVPEEVILSFFNA